jgi:hypothetical protein
MWSPEDLVSIHKSGDCGVSGTELRSTSTLATLYIVYYMAIRERIAIMLLIENFLRMYSQGSPCMIHRKKVLCGSDYHLAGPHGILPERILGQGLFGFSLLRF